MSANKSIVISCAGIGSRLGLSTTKALIQLHGKSLIAWQLEYFKDIEDIRIVVGFQANEVIQEVLKYRNDVIFVYNHNFFETKTGASFYLGARHANTFVIEYDGDLLVHPDDIAKCIYADHEYIAYSEKSSEDAVYVKTDDNGNVLSFSRNNGDYEWSGPACVLRNSVRYTSGNVYNMLEDRLPMRGLKIRAFDIDTYNDYQRALEATKGWFS